MRGLGLSLRIITLVAFARAQYSEQIVMDDPIVPMTRLQPSLADLLTVDQSVSIFYSYLRETEVSKTLNDAQGSMTVFAPKNRAVMALAVKPHQDPVKAPGDITITEEQFDKLSKKNVERWISAHLIPRIFDLAPGSFETALAGKNITVTDTKQDSPRADWDRFVVEGDVRIVDRKEASNGVLYVIDGTVQST